ncbi:hypothetical protein Prudu_018537 [Prunus dulcis]|uniref:Ubiquitin-like domain-containing protein n=1 Tax=Prunus dulcis TaxID=3755 RepID=A0A4Y1RR07_PRUDU|nr:hypothetical protein Prudu_018537 [Prunus dulcis]
MSLSLIWALTDLTHHLCKKGELIRLAKNQIQNVLSLPKEEDDDAILLKIQSQQHPDITYMTCPSLPLGHVLRDYCRLRLLYDGKRVREKDTPEQHEMENEDVIDAMLDQIAGDEHPPRNLIRLSLVKEEDPIILKLQKQDEHDIVPLKYLIRDYCERKHLVYEEMRFLFDGKRINGSETPEQLEMEDDDVIDVMSDQFGGQACP